MANVDDLGSRPTALEFVARTFQVEARQQLRGLEVGQPTQTNLRDGGKHRSKVTQQDHARAVAQLGIDRLANMPREFAVGDIGALLDIAQIGNQFSGALLHFECGHVFRLSIRCVAERRAARRHEALRLAASQSAAVVGLKFKVFPFEFCRAEPAIGAAVLRAESTHANDDSASLDVLLENFCGNNVVEDGELGDAMPNRKLWKATRNARARTASAVGMRADQPALRTLLGMRAAVGDWHVMVADDAADKKTFEHRASAIRHLHAEFERGAIEIQLERHRRNANLAVAVDSAVLAPSALVPILMAFTIQKRRVVHSR